MFAAASFYALALLSQDSLSLPAGAETAPLGTLGHVEKVGSGPIDMIILPGAPFGWKSWEPFMQRNKDRYTMYAVTVPGYDGTPSPAKPEEPNYADYTWSQAVIDAVIGLAKKEMMDRPVILGHHLMSDNYAVYAAIKEPSLFRAVVVAAGSYAWVLQSPSNPMKTAKGPERAEIVLDQYRPMYAGMSEEGFKGGQIAAALFSRNGEHAERLHKEQLANSIPIQVRYLLEYMTRDVGDDLARLKTPLLVISQKPRTLSEIGESYREALEASGSNVTTWKAQLAVFFGSEERAAMILSAPWHQAKEKEIDVKVVDVAESGIFIMDDQPALFDKHLADFVNGL